LSVSHDVQHQAQAVIDERVASGAETGVQVAVMHEGRVVVDAVAGLADPRTAAPVAAGTLFFAASTGKGLRRRSLTCSSSTASSATPSAWPMPGPSSARTARTA
jgi:hypothetical protein